MATAERTPFEGTVFLDRDGTINRKAQGNGYITTVEDFALLPTVAEAVRTLNEARRRVIVVTNQRGIALGQMTFYDLEMIHQHMLELLAAQGASVDAIYYCPHDRLSCNCRKPKVGLFRRAAREHVDVRLDECAIFGDSERDMLAGRRLGMVCVLVGDVTADQGDSPSDVAWCHYHAAGLLEGVRWLLGDAVHERRAARRPVALAP